MALWNKLGLPIYSRINFSIHFDQWGALWQCLIKKKYCSEWQGAISEAITVQILVTWLHLVWERQSVFPAIFRISFYHHSQAWHSKKHRSDSGDEKALDTIRATLGTGRNHGFFPPLPRSHLSTMTFLQQQCEKKQANVKYEREMFTCKMNIVHRGNKTWHCPFLSNEAKFMETLNAFIEA